METALIGIGISLLMQLVKYLTEKYGEQLGKTFTIGIVVLLSVVAGVIAWALKDNVSLIKNIGEVLAYATTFYALVVKNMPLLRTNEELKGTPNEREEKLAENLDIDK